MSWLLAVGYTHLRDEILPLLAAVVVVEAVKQHIGRCACETWRWGVGSGRSERASIGAVWGQREREREAGGLGAGTGAATGQGARRGAGVDLSAGKPDGTGTGHGGRGLVVRGRRSKILRLLIGLFLFTYHIGKELRGSLAHPTRRAHRAPCSAAPAGPSCDVARGPRCL